MKSIILLAFIYMFSTNVFAAPGTVTGKVISIKGSHGQTTENVWVAVEIDGTITGEPGCATDSSSRMTVNPTTNAGAVLLSLAQQALATGVTVTVYGKDQCNIVSNLEDLDHITVDD